MSNVFEELGFYETESAILCMKADIVDDAGLEIDPMDHELEDLIDMAVQKGYLVQVRVEEREDVQKD